MPEENKISASASAGVWEGGTLTHRQRARKMEQALQVGNGVGELVGEVVGEVMGKLVGKVVAARQGRLGTSQE